MKVWVLDRVGYDACGGNAAVYSTLERAMAAVDWVTFDQQSDGEWVQRLARPGSTEDVWTIAEHTMDK